MKTDTKRTVEQILKQGYYKQGTALGAGGWPTLYKAGVDEWKKFVITFHNTDEQFEIHAKDEHTAIKAFESMFHLDEVPYTIGRVDYVVIKSERE